MEDVRPCGFGYPARRQRHEVSGDRPEVFGCRSRIVDDRERHNDGTTPGAHKLGLFDDLIELRLRRAAPQLHRGAPKAEAS